MLTINNFFIFAIFVFAIFVFAILRKFTNQMKIYGRKYSQAREL